MPEEKNFTEKTRTLRRRCSEFKLMRREVATEHLERKRCCSIFTESLLILLSKFHHATVLLVRQSSSKQENEKKTLANIYKSVVYIFVSFTCFPSIFSLNTIAMLSLKFLFVFFVSKSEFTHYSCKLSNDKSCNSEFQDTQ